jgi:hypothetical protein
MKRGFAVAFYRPNEDFNPIDNPPNVVLNVVIKAKWGAPHLSFYGELDQKGELGPRAFATL